MLQTTNTLRILLGSGDGFLAVLFIWDCFLAPLFGSGETKAHTSQLGRMKLEMELDMKLEMKLKMKLRNETCSHRRTAPERSAIRVVWQSLHNSQREIGERAKQNISLDVQKVSKMTVVS